VGGESFTIQCELLRHKEPHEIPPPQDPIPENNILLQPMPFDFIGLGQPAHGAGNPVIGQGDWEPWPEPAQDAVGDEGEAAPITGQGMAEAEVEPEDAKSDAEGVLEGVQGEQAGIVAANHDLEPVIINPVENDPLGFGERTRHLLPEQGEDFQLNLVPISQEASVDREAQAGGNLDLNLLPEDQNPYLEGQHHSPINFLVDEFSQDQLVSADNSANHVLEEVRRSQDTVDTSNLGGNMQITLGALSIRPSIKLFGRELDIGPSQPLEENQAAKTIEKMASQGEEAQHGTLLVLGPGQSQQELMVQSQQELMAQPAKQMGQQLVEARDLAAQLKAH